jgi:hypothetical protein
VAVERKGARIVADWEPIRRQSPPDVEGVVGRDRLAVSIVLNRVPEEKWVRYFEMTFARRQDEPGEFPLPQVSGSVIRIQPLDNELESWVKNIDDVIEQANRYYESSVLPDLRATEERQVEADRERERRIEEARRRAKNL